MSHLLLPSQGIITVFRSSDITSCQPADDLHALYTDPSLVRNENCQVQHFSLIHIASTSKKTYSGLVDTNCLLCFSKHNMKEGYPGNHSKFILVSLWYRYYFYDKILCFSLSSIFIRTFFHRAPKNTIIPSN